MTTTSLPSERDVCQGVELAIVGLFAVLVWAFMLAFEVLSPFAYAAATYSLLMTVTGFRQLYLRRDRVAVDTRPLSPRTAPLIPYATFDAWVTADGVVYFGGREPIMSTRES